MRGEKGDNRRLTDLLEDIRPLKDHEREMAFLSQEQIKSLLHHVSIHSHQDMLKIVKICLSTGARWNEAAQLRGLDWHIC